MQAVPVTKQLLDSCSYSACGRRCGMKWWGAGRILNSDVRV